MKIRKVKSDPVLCIDEGSKSGDYSALSIVRGSYVEFVLRQHDLVLIEFDDSVIGPSQSIPVRQGVAGFVTAIGDQGIELSYTQEPVDDTVAIPLNRIVRITHLTRAPAPGGTICLK